MKRTGPQITRQARQQALIRQIARLGAHITLLDKQADQIASLRLGLLLLGGFITALCFFNDAVLPFSIALIVTLLGFSGLVMRHRRCKAMLTQFHVAQRIRTQHLARMTLDWDHLPRHLEDVPLNALEIDLDLRDLQRLINLSATRSGAMRLREWLTEPAPSLEQIEARQAILREMIPLRGFRNGLQRHSAIDARQYNPEPDTLLGAYSRLIDAPPVGRWVLLLGAMAALNGVLFVVSQAGLLPQQIAALGWVAYVGLYVWIYPRIGGLLRDATRIQAALGRMRHVMHHIESYPYQGTPALAALAAPIVADQPSHSIRSMMWIHSAASLQANPYLWLALNAILPWDAYWRWRLQHQGDYLARRLPGWLSIWRDLDALNSLATFAWLTPEAHFPRLNRPGAIEAGQPAFMAKKIAHPLLPADRRISNEIHFDALGELVIITGSNMAGKSSFLRTLGVNMCLAYAGAPALAESFSLGVFRLMSCIRVTDSLDDGISYFYAEVRRLRQILDALQTEDAAPLFFLIDEIFRGTNNRERLLGSQAYIAALLQERGLGLIATHDLELTQLEKEHSSIRNMHFREQIVSGRMAFDYVLRPGPCPTTNALAIMALEGLPVPPPTEIKP